MSRVRFRFLVLQPLLPTLLVKIHSTDFTFAKKVHIFPTSMAPENTCSQERDPTDDLDPPLEAHGSLGDLEIL